MTVTLDLPHDLEVKAAEEAADKGQALPDFLLTIIKERFVRPQFARSAPSQEQLDKNQAALALLRSWREQNATSDPEELKRRQADWEEFKAALDEDRPSERKLFP